MCVRQKEPDHRFDAARRLTDETDQRRRNNDRDQRAKSEAVGEGDREEKQNRVVDQHPLLGDHQLEIVAVVFAVSPKKEAQENQYDDQAIQPRGGFEKCMTQKDAVENIDHPENADRAERVNQYADAERVTRVDPQPGANGRALGDKADQRADQRQGDDARGRH